MDWPPASRISAEVVEDLPGLGADVSHAQLAGAVVDRRLARQDDQAAGAMTACEQRPIGTGALALEGGMDEGQDGFLRADAAVASVESESTLLARVMRIPAARQSTAATSGDGLGRQRDSQSVDFLDERRALLGQPDGTAAAIGDGRVARRT